MARRASPSPSVLLGLLLLGICVSDAMSKASSLNIEMLNQKGMGREVLQRSNVKPMQKLADSQHGSTVHRFTSEEVEERLHKHSPTFPGLVKSSFIITESNRQTRSQHASTITEVEPGVFVAAWFGGTWERMGDVGIWSSRYSDGAWGAAQQLAKPLMDETYPGWMAACYNPVLLHVPHLNTTLLFFKVGVNPSHWRGYIMRSPDRGVTWSDAAPMEPGILGPAKNPPFILSDGTILSPSSDELGDWTSHVEVSKDDGYTWKREPDLHFGRGIIQPSMFRTLDGTMHMVMRTHKDKTVAATQSTDNGKTWKRITDANVTAPNSGICAVGLKDGRVLLVHNDLDMKRAGLDVSMSYDLGMSYEKVATLERDSGKYKRTPECLDQNDPKRVDPPEYSYPTVIQASDGLVHVTYTFSYYGAGGRCTGRENVKHVVLDPCQIGDVSRASVPEACT